MWHRHDLVAHFPRLFQSFCVHTTRAIFSRFFFVRNPSSTLLKSFRRAKPSVIFHHHHHTNETTTTTTTTMDDRIALAQRRKTLLERQKKFEREQQALAKKTERELHKFSDQRGGHSEAAAATTTAVATEQPDGSSSSSSTKQISNSCASGSGSAWRSREHISLKNSPRNLRLGPYDPDPAVKKRSLAETKPISAALYERLSFQTIKKSQAVLEEMLY